MSSFVKRRAVARLGEIEHEGDLNEALRAFSRFGLRVVSIVARYEAEAATVVLEGQGPADVGPQVFWAEVVAQLEEDEGVIVDAIQPSRLP